MSSATGAVDGDFVDTKDSDNIEQELNEGAYSSEYSTDSEEEEEEPKLKYERVRGDLPTLLERDSLTSIVSNDKVNRIS